MYDENWDLINGDAAHAIEVLNQANQVNVIEALFQFLVHHAGVDPVLGCKQLPNERAICELHRTGTLFLLDKPGEYRDGQVNVCKDGVVIYTPPAADDVGTHMAEFVATLAQKWLTEDAVNIAAFCLWRLNWVHPFKNGNGRTARGFAYACLCLKLGFIPGGSPTILDLIMQNKPEFEAALAHADTTYATNGEGDLGLLSAFVTRLLIEQLSTIPAGPDEQV